MAAGTKRPNRQRYQKALKSSAPTFVCLTEGTQDGDLVSKDLGWWPGNTSRIGIDTIYDKLTTSSDVIDRVFEDRHAAGSFDDDVKPIRILLFQFLELRPYRPVSNKATSTDGMHEPESFLERATYSSPAPSFDCQPACCLSERLLLIMTYALRKLHLQTLGSRYNDVASTILAKQLSKYKTSRSSTKHEHT